ncbi:HDOD domain-containing protein [Vallitaleaceae bacterium 9-2]
MEDNKALTMEEIISRVQEIPPFPQTIIRIMEITKNPEAGAKELEEEIIKDQGLTAKILQLANSAFYHGRRDIETVREAAVLLGFEAVRTMVLTTVIGKFMEKELPGYALEKEALWKQSQISAIMTRAVAKKVGYKKVDQAYTAGLLRDIGKVVLDQYVADAYQEINSLVEKGYTFIDAEEEVLGFNHGQIGAKVAEKWNLPDELVEVIATHHHPKEASINPKLVYITHVADSLIMMMGIHIGIDGLAYEFFSEGAKALNLNEKMLSEIMSEVADDIEKKSVFLEL